MTKAESDRAVMTGCGCVVIVAGVVGGAVLVLLYVVAHFIWKAW